MNKKNEPDIEAEIYFLSTDEGGRKTPAYSGYRSQFYYDGEDWDSMREYVEAAEVYPGQTVLAQLFFTRPEIHVEKLYVGKEFLVREGQKIVACGIVTKILNLHESTQRLSNIRKEI